MPLVLESRQLFNSLLNTGAVRFNRYPANAAGATVTCGKSYAYGAIAQVIANAAITIDSWLSSISADTPSATDLYLIGATLGAVGSEVLLAENLWTPFQVTAAGVYALATWNLPRPIFVSSAANNRIGAEGGAGTAATPTLVIGVTMGTRFRGTGT